MTETTTNQSERSMSWAPMALAAISTFVLLFIAGTAHAGVMSQIHSFKVGGTIFVQEVSEKTGDDILDKEKFSEKDLGANCLLQEKLDKGQYPVLVLNDACGDINDNEIQILSQTPPLVTVLGQIDFDVDNLIVNQKKSVDDTLTLPATVELACLGGVDIDVEASAIATIKLGKETGCFESMKLKNGSGTGTIDATDVIVDGLKADAKKPSN